MLSCSNAKGKKGSFLTLVALGPQIKVFSSFKYIIYIYLHTNVSLPLIQAQKTFAYHLNEQCRIKIFLI